MTSQQSDTDKQQLSSTAIGASGAQPSMATMALEFIKDGDVVGLGTGRAATAFVRALGDAVKAGLRVTAVSTSQVTAALAAQLEIPLTTLEEVSSIDVTLDGADEVDPKLDLIKGYGGAHVREKSWPPRHDG